VGRGESTFAQRRLDPTPWLNVNFREPLYLKDVPVQHDDTRNELEQKFPEFFYNKLTAEVRRTMRKCLGFSTTDSRRYLLVEHRRVYLSLARAATLAPASDDDGANDVMLSSVDGGHAGL
jgi:hypothetical protein